MTLYVNIDKISHILLGMLVVTFLSGWGWISYLTGPLATFAVLVGGVALIAHYFTVKQLGGGWSKEWSGRSMLPLVVNTISTFVVWVLFPDLVGVFTAVMITVLALFTVLIGCLDTPNLKTVWKLFENCLDFDLETVLEG